MKTTIAETPHDVRDWVEKHEHHSGRWLNASKEDVQHPREAVYLELANYVTRILIPVAIHNQTYLIASMDAGHMFRWNFEAEEAAKSTADV